MPSVSASLKLCTGSTRACLCCSAMRAGRRQAECISAGPACGGCMADRAPHRFGPAVVRNLARLVRHGGAVAHAARPRCLDEELERARALVDLARQEERRNRHHLCARRRRCAWAERRPQALEGGGLASVHAAKRPRSAQDSEQSIKLQCVRNVIEMRTGDKEGAAHEAVAGVHGLDAVVLMHVVRRRAHHPAWPAPARPP